MNRVLVGMALLHCHTEFLASGCDPPGHRGGAHAAGLPQPAARIGGVPKLLCPVALIRAIYFFLLLILNTTIWVSAGVLSALLVPLKWASLLFLLAVYLCFWQGLRAVRGKSGASVPSQGCGGAGILVSPDVRSGCGGVRRADFGRRSAGCVLLDPPQPVPLLPGTG